MSEHIARQALTRMHMREVAVAANLTTLAADLRQMSVADPAKEQASLLARREELCAAFGLVVGPQTKPFAFAQGVAVIPVTGSLINRFGGSYGYVTGYNFIRSQVAAAGLDPDVTAIVFDMNSYGGEAAGCFECAADIPRLANGKPTLAVVDSNCYSACYALASQCDKIAVTPSGGVGSVGVVSMHVDISKMIDSMGVTVTFIYAGDHKVDGNMFEPLSDEVKADMQASITKMRLSFAELVAKGRGIDVQAVIDTQARCYRADDALRLGLIDAIATPQGALTALLGELSGSTVQLSQEKEPEMADQEKPGAQAASTQDTAAAAQEARTAERARIQGIQSCDESKGREKLASHLALNTDLSVDAAKAILAASPAEKTQAAAPAAAANPFDAAMNASAHPQVGADATGDAPGAEQQAAAMTSAILADYAKASGRKFDPAQK